MMYPFIQLYEWSEITVFSKSDSDTGIDFRRHSREQQ